MVKTSIRITDADEIRKIFKRITVINIIMMLILLVILYYIYKYLVNLNKCKCMNSVNVKHIQYVEIFYIIITIIIVLVQVFVYFNLSNIGPIKYIKNMFSKHLMYFIVAALVYFVIRYAVDIYLVYNVAKMQSSASCDCSSSWELYAIYIQTIFAIIDVIGVTTITFNVGPITNTITNYKL